MPDAGARLRDEWRREPDRYHPPVSAPRFAQLDSGLRIVVVERPDLHSAAVVLHVGLGARHESRADAGLSHFLEHMLFQGCDGFADAASLTRRVEDCGGSLDAWTTPEFTTLALGVHRAHWEEGLDILARVARTPRFDPERVEAEKRVVRQELAAHVDPALGTVSVDDLAYNLLWQPDRREATTAGSAAAVARFSAARCARHHAAGYRTDNMVLCCSGAVDAGRVRALAAERFGGAPPAGRPPSRRALDATQRAPRVLLRAPRWPTVAFRLAHRAFPWHDRRSAALQVLNEILGGGTSSRLFLRVREELGLVYDVGSELALFSDGGSFDITGSAERENVAPTLAAVLDECARLAAGDVDAGLVATTTERIRCRLDFLHDSAYETAEWYGKQSLLLGPDRVRSPDDAMADVARVTAADVTALARELFRPSGRVGVAVGPLTAAQRRRIGRLLQQRAAIRA